MKLKLILCAFNIHRYVVKPCSNGPIVWWDGKFECSRCHAIAPFTSRNMPEPFSLIKLIRLTLSCGFFIQRRKIR